MGTQGLRHPGRDTEPADESRYGLVQQHAEPVHGKQATDTRLRQQRRLERGVDDIADDGIVATPCEIDLERRLSGHAKGGGVDDQPRPWEQIVEDGKAMGPDLPGGPVRPATPLSQGCD